MDSFSDAVDTFDAIGRLDERYDEMTIDQQLKLAEVKALASIALALSAIHHGGINPNYDPDVD
ncbi:hypothetical protein ACQP2P_08430 [Dactylosporangium sp. CA-139114]|uniref:hypothetical protein n=1 Tax=Dactylosporangium sp. CA-139114 TaxID=3239931 RepID=UPI003D990CAE|nr:hypothetical protein GCM10020063_069890 [Dactylosporangium thailandense]